MTSIDIYRREFGVRSLKQVSFLKERGMGSDLNIQHRIGVIHKKVGPFQLHLEKHLASVLRM
jgi:hypothetical protein